MKLTGDSSICKQIDDDIAFVTIKHWYGQENENFQYVNSLLSFLKNSSGMDK